MGAYEEGKYISVDALKEAVVNMTKKETEYSNLNHDAFFGLRLAEKILKDALGYEVWKRICETKW